MIRLATFISEFTSLYCYVFMLYCLVSTIRVFPTYKDLIMIRKNFLLTSLLLMPCCILFHAICWLLNCMSLLFNLSWCFFFLFLCNLLFCLIVYLFFLLVKFVWFLKSMYLLFIVVQQVPNSFNWYQSGYILLSLTILILILLSYSLSHINIHLDRLPWRRLLW